MDVDIIKLLMKRKNEEDVLCAFPKIGNHKSKSHRPFIRVKKGENFYTFWGIRNANKYEYDEDSDLPLVYMNVKTGKKWRVTQ